MAVEVKPVPQAQELPGERPLMIALLVAIVVVILTVVIQNPTLVRFWPFSAIEFVQLMTPLILVSLFVERSLEIFIKGSYGEGEERLQKQIEKGEADETTLVTYKARTRRVAFAAAVLLCLTISAMGVRALEQLVDPPVLGRFTDMQLRVFRTVDVVLTGTLLAGGADGLHKLVSLFLTQVDRLKQQTKGKVP